MAYYLQHHHNNHQKQSEYYYHHHTTTHPYEAQPTSKYIPIEQRHISTLFVSGLPDDILPREIHNLFRRRPGFDSCQLKFTGRGSQVVAFVTFFNHQSAVMALQALDGVKFDPQAGSTLHVELARSNSRRKRKSGSGPYVVIDKRKKAADNEETSSDDGGNDSDNLSESGEPDVHSNVKSLLHSTLPPPPCFASTRSVRDKKNEVHNDSGTAKKTEKSSSDDLRPCSTLFIANLGPNCSEEELREALSQFPGLNGLKLRTRGGMPVAFVDYEEVEQATNAMEALQGSMLPSSDRGGMHIEYARSKMRKP